MPRPKPQRCTKVRYRSAGEAYWAMRNIPHALLHVYRCGKHMSPTWHTTSQSRV